MEGYETIGDLLTHIKDSLIQQASIKKLWQLIAKLYHEILIDFGVDLDHFIRNIINDDSLRNRINRFAGFLFKGQSDQFETKH